MGLCRAQKCKRMNNLQKWNYRSHAFESISLCFPCFWYLVTLCVFDSKMWCILWVLEFPSSVLPCLNVASSLWVLCFVWDVVMIFLCQVCRYPIPLYSLLLVALSHTLPKKFYLIFFARLSTLTICYRLLLSAPYLTISLSAVFRCCANVEFLTVYTTWLCYTNLLSSRSPSWLGSPSLQHRPEWTGFSMLPLQVLAATVSSFRGRTSKRVMCMAHFGTSFIHRSQVDLTSFSACLHY